MSNKRNNHPMDNNIEIQLLMSSKQGGSNAALVQKGIKYPNEEQFCTVVGVNHTIIMWAH